MGLRTVGARSGGRRTAAVLVVVAVLAGVGTTEAIGRAGGGGPAPGDGRPGGASKGLDEAYGRLPLAFEPNQGQCRPDVRFVARGGGYALALTGSAAVLSLQPGPDQAGASVSLVPVGGDPRAELVAEDPLATRVNDLRGDDPSGWHTDIPTFGKVAEHDVWPGVDLVYSGRQGRLEYDWEVAPGADPRQIRLGLEGLDHLRIDAGGNLVGDTAAGPVVQHRPVAYQDVDGTRRLVAADFVLRGTGEAGVRLGSYDPSRRLIVDPWLLYTSFIGGTDSGAAIAVDGTGAAYVTGTASSLAVTPGAFDADAEGGQDAFVAKLDPAGTSVVYATYLGGSRAESGLSIAVDATGATYVGGETYSTDFPVSPGAYDSTLSGIGDAFVAKLDPSGSSLAYATLLGGTGRDDLHRVAIDPAGAAYVLGTTWSDNHVVRIVGFPFTPGAFSTGPAFLAKLEPGGSALEYAVGFGAISGDTNVRDVAVDAAGAAYLTGTSVGAVLPTTAGTLAPSPLGGTDGWVAKVAPSGAGLVYGTYLGGGGPDIGAAIGVDTLGRAYVGGSGEVAGSTNPFHGSPFCCAAFAARLDAGGSELSYLTYVGIGVVDNVALDPSRSGSVAIAGNASMVVVTPDAFRHTYAANGAFLATVTPGGAISYATYFLPGVAPALDDLGQLYVVGTTTPTALPRTPSSADTTSGGAWIGRFGPSPNPPPGPVPADPGLLGAASATLESSVGSWIPLYGSSVAASAEVAHTGSRSLAVNLEAEFWGVELRTPDVAATAGPKSISYFAMARGTNLDVTMTVNWLDGTGADLQADVLAIPILGAAWQQATADVTAPPGTARVTVDLSGTDTNDNDKIWLDDVIIGNEPVSTTTTVAPTTTTAVPTTTTTIPLTGNVIDPDSSTLEGSAGEWLPWFSSAVSRSTAQAHTGAASLRVDVTAAHGWGVQMSTWPGFPTTPGNKTISFWGRAGSPAGGLGATMTVAWLDASGALLATDSASIPALTTTWKQGSAVVTAPAGTAFADVSLSDASGKAGDYLFLDDIVVADSPVAPPPPPTAVNALDVHTSTIEGSVGQWVPWFSTEVSESTAEARTGASSLEVDVTAPYGWGVTLANWPGFAARPGPHTVGFWAKAGTGGVPAVTMEVTWRSASGSVLQTDLVTMPLSAAWQQASAHVTAPAGTARVHVDFLNGSGGAGDVVFLDDIVVTDEPVPPNALDADTSSLEGSVGRWVSWFSTAVSRSTAAAHGGTASLEIDVTAPYGWGVTLSNWPGFDAAPGPHILGFWARAGSGTGLSATMQVTWRTASGTVLQTDLLALPLLGTWAQTTAAVTAPPGTAKVLVDLLDSSGGPGDVVFVDDVTVFAT